MRISDWSSDVCSSDLCVLLAQMLASGDFLRQPPQRAADGILCPRPDRPGCAGARCRDATDLHQCLALGLHARTDRRGSFRGRSEEHTSELQSLMRISYAVFCLKKKTTQTIKTQHAKT